MLSRTCQRVRDSIRKSFLVLFFKKEPLPLIGPAMPPTDEATDGLPQPQRNAAVAASDRFSQKQRFAAFGELMGLKKEGSASF